MTDCIQNTTPSHQQRQHWLSEQALAWSGLPVVTMRPTMLLQSFLQLAAPSVRNRDRIELPFGRGKTSPVSAADVAQVVAAVLADPGPHLGRIYEPTGPQSQDLDGIAREFSDALNREVTYSDVSPEEWEQRLKKQGLPEHLTGHLLAMGELHRSGRYDRRADVAPRSRRSACFQFLMLASKLWQTVGRGARRWKRRGRPGSTPVR